MMRHVLSPVMSCALLAHGSLWAAQTPPPADPLAAMDAVFPPPPAEELAAITHPQVRDALLRMVKEDQYARRAGG